MKTIYIHELKQGFKSLLIWAFALSAMGLACIMIYRGMEGEIADMAEGFAQMGAFSAAFGMDRMSLATLTGFYSVEVATITGIGGAMFAAVISRGMLSKEEAGHTGEFLFTLPLSRGKILLAKGLCLLSEILIFNAACTGVFALGFWRVEGGIPGEFWLFHTMQAAAQAVFCRVCFFISSLSKKVSYGPGLGIVLLFYRADMLCRISPDLKDFTFLSPFSMANSTRILGGEGLYLPGIVFGAILSAVCFSGAAIVYTRRDLSR